MNDRFVRGYALAIAMVLLFSAALWLGDQLGREMEESQRQTYVFALRAIHQRDQKEAERD